MNAFGRDARLRITFEKRQDALLFSYASLPYQNILKISRQLAHSNQELTEINSRLLPLVLKVSLAAITFFFHLSFRLFNRSPILQLPPVQSSTLLYFAAQSPSPSSHNKPFSFRLFAQFPRNHSPTFTLFMRKLPFHEGSRLV